MLKVGLTGGIACGKTTVASMLKARGAHVIFADTIAHKLMSPGETVYQAVVAAFGKQILNDDGTISRPKLAEAAFPNRVQELNELVHPAVVAYQNRWMEDVARHDPHGIAVVEAALIFEAGAEKHFDKVITVRCDIEHKAARFAERQHIPRPDAEREVAQRMAAQIPDDEKAAKSDYVIDNSGTREDLERLVDSVWQELRNASSRV